ncbi:MAG: CHAT domain-containing protein [Tunicatimonas sp.]
MNRSRTISRSVDLPYSYFIYANISQTYQRYDSALHYYQLALINATFDFNDSTVTANPQDITEAISLLQLFEVLNGKAAAWHQYYQQDQDTAKLNHSLTTYQLAIRVAQHIQKTYDNDEAKLFLVNKVAPVYEEAIATAVQLHQLTGNSQYATQAFQFSEASKASVLTESLRDVKIKTSGGVNDSLVQDERRLKQQITALRLKLAESQDSAQNEAYRQQLIDQEIALARTIKYLHKDEHYYRRKYQPDTLDMAALQRTLLGEGEVLLEYFLGKDTLYLFSMTAQSLAVASLPRLPELDSALQRTQRQLYDYQPGQGSDEASLAILYRYLIAPVADAVAGASKLIIVPDGPLHYLPFDLLSPDGRVDNSLLHSHPLHYGYSASLLQQAINERRGYPTEAVLAMAPFTGGGGGNVRSRGFSPLRDSQAEVESVGGSIYTEGDATKRRFLRVAGSYNVLHLATHAAVDAENPSQSFIAFYPQQRDSLADYRLYTHELYNMRLDSVKLVILSACEAGNGQLVRGEGVMSLARAFAYAGCPNIMTTLWKADDRSSAWLTKRLHQYLKQGWEKDEALQQAKLDYLSDPEVHPARKAPYYWANFVFIGDPAPLYDDRRQWWLIAVGLLLLVGGGALWWRLRRRKLLRQAA